MADNRTPVYVYISVTQSLNVASPTVAVFATERDANEFRDEHRKKLKRYGVAPNDCIHLCLVNEDSHGG